MNKSELAKLGYDTEGFVSDADYVPNVFSTDDGVYTDLVFRAYLQLEELDVMGGVNVLGGPSERRDDIYRALEDGVEFLAAVERFGDEDQWQRAGQLVVEGRVTGP